VGPPGQELESNEPSVPPTPARPASAVERKYTATIDDIIQRHRYVKHSPEYYAALLTLKKPETVVSFELDRQGRVSKVAIDRPSGSDFLDDQALRIVARRQGHLPPFPPDAWPGVARQVFTINLVLP